jgi:hypothetical protein
MADYMVGACSRFNLYSGAGLALGVQEGGGTGNNWLQLGSSAVSVFQSLWAANNGTGQPTPSASQVDAIDSLNAAAGIYYLSTRGDCGYSNWQGLQARYSAYNGLCSGCSCPYPQAYAWSCLFLAYGNGYGVSGYTYDGAWYPASPSGTQTKYHNSPCGPGAYINPPTFSVSYGLRTIPLGSNSNGKQIVLLATENVDYVSSLQVNVNLYGSPYRQAMVTSDADFAARVTQNYSYVVVCVGGPAVTAINSSASRLGLQCVSFSSFSAWEASPSYGYVNCAGATRSQSYSEANTQTFDASQAGW